MVPQCCTRCLGVPAGNGFDNGPMVTHNNLRFSGNGQVQAAQAVHLVIDSRKDAHTASAGISAPKGTPHRILDKLEAAVVQAMAASSVKQRLELLGFAVPPLGAKPRAAFVKSEEVRWTRVIKTSGFKTP